MRWMAILLVITLAGCTNAPAEDTTEAPPVAVEEPVEGNQTEEPVQVVAGQLNASYDYRTLDAGLQRYRMVAHGDTLVDAAFAVGIYANGFDPACAAFAIHGTQSAGNATQNATTWGASFVGWEGDADVYVDVHAGGNEMTVVPDQFNGQDGSTLLGAEASWSDQFTVAAGHELWFEIGSSRPEMFEPTATGERAYGTFDISMLGDFTLEPQPPAPLRCGTGPREAEGGMGVSTYITDYEDGGRIGHTTSTAATLIVTGNNGAEGTLDVDFLGTSHPATQGIALSAPTGGAMGLTFHEWTSNHEPGWMFAETYWPFV